MAMHYTKENCSGMSSEISFMDEIRTEETVETEEVSSEETDEKNPKEKKRKNNKEESAVSSKEVYIVNLKVSSKVHQRIKILCDLEGISCSKFYSDAMMDKLKSMAKKHSDIEKLRSIILGE